MDRKANTENAEHLRLPIQTRYDPRGEIDVRPLRRDIRAAGFGLVDEMGMHFRDCPNMHTRPLAPIRPTFYESGCFAMLMKVPTQRWWVL